MTMSPYWQPDLCLPRVTDLDPRLLLERGLRGVLLDLDNTLTLWKSLDIPSDIQAWVTALKEAGLRGCILSNALTKRRVQLVADPLGLPWVTRALKPFPACFRRAMKMLDTMPDTTAVVGDQLFTDIYGGKRLGLFTVLVDPISPHESFFTQLIQRPLERMAGRRAASKEVSSNQ